ncbi:MAG TPA: hypothetical protein IGS40_20485 [Trichormus sp. M33_DOE_039]|nr:hypothetical protein [Trichormus sp. M33_DOE_039]
MEPNPLTPFPTFAQRVEDREGGTFKASLRFGERFGEGFFRSREKSSQYINNVSRYIGNVSRYINNVERYIGNVKRYINNVSLPYVS